MVVLLSLQGFWKYFRQMTIHKKSFYLSIFQFIQYCNDFFFPTFKTKTFIFINIYLYIFFLSFLFFLLFIFFFLCLLSVCKHNIFPLSLFHVFISFCLRFVSKHYVFPLSFLFHLFISFSFYLGSVRKQNIFPFSLFHLFFLSQRSLSKCRISFLFLHWPAPLTTQCLTLGSKSFHLCWCGYVMVFQS